MKLNRRNTEIRNQKHEMWAEGAEDDQMNEQDISDHLLTIGYSCSNIEIGFDDLQSLWRWSCDISPLNPTT